MVNCEKGSPSNNLAIFWMIFGATLRFANFCCFVYYWDFLFMFFNTLLEIPTHTHLFLLIHFPVVNIVYVTYHFIIMQISENLLRVIFMLSTIVAVTDCCSSRLLLLKEHTLQIVQHRLPNINIADDSDYGYDDYDQLQQQQQQQQQLEQQQQQQKIPQYVAITNGDIEFNKNSTDEHSRSRDDNEANNTDTNLLLGAMQLRDFETTTTEQASDMRATTAESITTTTITTTTESTITAEGTTTYTTTTAAGAKLVAAEGTTTTTASAPITNSKESTNAQIADSSNTQKISTVALNELGTESSTSTTKTSTIPTTIISKMENVMNDLKTAGDLLSLPCSGQFNTEFCLNRGRCFRYPIGNDTIHSCICADGYIGERCESKSMNGSFIPSIAGAHKKKIVMARIVFSFPMLMALSVIYIMIGAAIVFKRPAAIPDMEISPSATSHPSSRPTLSPHREPFELLSEDDAAGEFIMMNSYTIATTYTTYMD
ncbi:protein gurken isoform X2 [Eurosta solidaginis]|uniref:protein gurken isoform X2 n=1 Tax=Eurosta solidaginis TaxID=178769 RepID=UPI003530CDA6